MRGVLVLVLVLVAGGATAADKPDTAAVKAEQQKLDGTWLVASVEKNGKSSTVAAEMRFIFSGDKVTREVTTKNKAGKAKTGRDTGTYTVDPTKTPKQLDVTMKNLSVAGTSTTVGVYDVDGDRLTYVVPKLPKAVRDANGKPSFRVERPTDLTSATGIVYILKREKQ